MGKKAFRDIFISILIAVGITLTVKEELLYIDGYSQYIHFLSYFKDHLNIFSGDLIYNWNIGLGDSTLGVIIYYLISPLNIILILFRKIEMLDILPYFIALKYAFICFTAQLYFKEVTGEKYKWIGTLIYIANYKILSYGYWLISWTDTFIFLPLVLFGIEKIIMRKGKRIYILSLFFLISTNYYLCILMIPHIAIYGVIRYIIVRGKKDVLLYFLKMIGVSIISFLLSAIVLIPATQLTMFSAKDIGSKGDYSFNINSLLSIAGDNYIGFNSSSETYITILGILVIIPYIIYKEKKWLYTVPILLMILGIFSGYINHLLNYTYSPAGSNFRYTIMLNIYIGILACGSLKHIVNDVDKNAKRLICIILVGLCMLLITQCLLENISVIICIINLIFLLIYPAILYSEKLLLDKKLRLITFVLALEVLAYSSYMCINKTSIEGDYVRDNKNILNYINNNYPSGRIENAVNPNIYNMYLAENVEGVEGYHSLMGDYYRKIGRVIKDVNTSGVINIFKGRNIISNLIGTRYYITRYNYCPYKDSRFLEYYNGYYIYELPVKQLKYFSSESVVKYNIPSSMVESDAMLYKFCYSDDSKRLEGFNKDYISECDLPKGEFKVNHNGDYYIKFETTNKDESKKEYIEFSINNVNIESKVYQSSNKDNKYSEVYIGYLKKGDKLNIKKSLNDLKLISIKGEYISLAIENMNIIKEQSIIKHNKGLSARFNLPKKGYVVFPVVNDNMWEITCNGEVLKPKVVNGGFISLELESGLYNVEINYKIKYFSLGLGISVVTLGVLIFIVFKKGIR